ncbi:MAG: hypothetical protein JSV67_06890 [Thermoplasmatales archaeon]|nr:MAG: hypothetical protein JSV67_06890 [Thermoplasmatales archaeon]
MNLNDKEKKIKSAIEEITGIKLNHQEVSRDKDKKYSESKLIIKDVKGKELAKVQNLRDFEDVLLSVNKDIILRCAKRNEFSKWLKSIGESELADKFLTIEKEFDEGEKLRKKMIDIIEEFRYSINQSYVTSYHRTSEEHHIKLSHIGTGSFGGKARGVAFLAKILSKYVTDDMFPGLKITIPRSIVLSTDVFDSFIEHNDLAKLDISHMSDERIASKFMAANLPATIIGDLRSFITNTRRPLIVRSSSLLEDSLLQPFAGIYASMLLPNESWGTDLRFQEVCNAIKYVYASTYFEKARTYIKSTPKNVSDEKMAVLLQEVVGNKYDTYFYPTISGVAKSYNYYPSGSCKPEDGIAYLTLGLGKSIVDGGSSYCFCPEKPKAPLFGTPKDFMRYSQKSYYALKLKSVYTIFTKNEETTLEKLEVDIAKKHGVLDKVASTYLHRDDSLYPGLYDEGAIVIDFGPIVNYDTIPLAKALKLLLRVGALALGYPIEIEFAVNFNRDESKPAELIILQIRSMIPPDKYQDVNIENIDVDKVLCYSENALGNGIISGFKDIVYIKSESFDMSNSNRAVSQIRRMNLKLMDAGKPYMLIGPGRWGSADPWLGIPIIWSDIAGVKVILETPYKERPIDPSQGSHFFHDMISSQVGYLITKKDKGNIDWKWLESLKLIEETEDVKHVETPSELEVSIDGKRGKAIIKEKLMIDNKIKTKK